MMTLEQFNNLKEIEVNEEVKQAIAIMKSVGFTTKQIFALYIFSSINA